MFAMQLLWTHIIPRKKGIRWSIALAVAFMGLINGLTVLLPARPGRLELLMSFLSQIAPFAPPVWPFTSTGRSAALILGFFLCLLALGLVRGKRRAWQLTIVLLPLSALAHLVKGLDAEEAILTMVLWLAVVMSKPFFRVGSDPWRARQGVVLLVLGLVLLFIYSLVGFYLLQPQFLTSGTVGEVLRLLLGRTLNRPATQLLPLTRRASWFLNSIPWLSATALLTGMFFLLRPISARWWMTYQKERLVQMRHKAVALVYRYGGHTHSFFALAPEILHYLAPHGEGVVNYRLTGNVAVVLGDPVCEPAAFERVTQGFLDFCSLQDWRAAIFQAHPEHIASYQKLGLHAFKLGEEAIVHPASFTLSGSAMSNVRTSCRRAERDGVSLSWYDGLPPHEVMEELQQLSCEWLERKGGKDATEMGFSLSRFDGLVEAAARAETLAALHSPAEGSQPREVPRLVTGVATDRTGKAVALVTFTPIYGTQATQSERSGWGWALDLMRRAPDAPPGVIELLIVRAIERFRARGAQVVSLGVVAMADTRQEMSTSQRQLASFVSEHLRLLETHRTLFFFKQKFHPCWESRYVVASSALALPGIALAVLRVHQS
jgi:lysylphosphatidylglycerol synthetase-like protein (DUF2156 family)